MFVRGNFFNIESEYLSVDFNREITNTIILGFIVVIDVILITIIDLQ